jgi:hypothetical protein
MNTRKLVWYCAAVVLLMLSGCKPFYQKMAEGEWKVDTYFKNGSDDTAAFLLLFGDYTITFYSNGDFVEEYLALNIVPTTNTGTWVIEKKPDGKIGEFQLRLTDESQVRTFDIKKISRDTINIYRPLGEGEDEEFFLEPVPET